MTAGRTAKVWASAANIAEGFLLGVSMRGYAFRACEMARRAWLARAYSPALRFPEKIGSNEKRFRALIGRESSSDFVRARGLKNPRFERADATREMVRGPAATKYVFCI